jgi:hypothetical protein
LTRREERLKAEGWTRRTVAAGPRLGEMVELYEDLGFEVRLEPFDAEEEDGDCRACFSEDRERFKVVYTRPCNDGGVS